MTPPCDFASHLSESRVPVVYCVRPLGACAAGHVEVRPTPLATDLVSVSTLGQRQRAEAQGTDRPACSLVSLAAFTAIAEGSNMRGLPK